MAVSVTLGNGHKLRILHHDADSDRVDSKACVESKKGLMQRRLGFWEY